MKTQNNTIVRQWYELYKSLTGTEVNKRIKEIKESGEVVHQKIYQLRALELVMLRKRELV